MALGHHEATDEAVKEAIRRGAKLVTHLGNGSRQVMPKFRGVIDEQLAEDGLMASFIADGHHVPFRTLQNFIRAKEASRAILVTDATAAAEMAPGVYRLSGIRVTLKPDGRVVLPDGKKLAGSSLTLDRAVLNVATNCGFSLDQAWQMGVRQPREAVQRHRQADGPRLLSTPAGSRCELAAGTEGEGLSADYADFKDKWVAWHPSIQMS